MSPLHEEDSALLGQIQRGDERAIATLFARYSKVVYAVALRVLRDPASAEDVLHEVFMQVWRNPHHLPAKDGALGGWLAVVTRNRSIDALRRKRPSEPIEEIAPVPGYNLGKEIDRNNLMERARVAIMKLPVEQRKTLEMAFFDGLTHMEIAEITGDPLGTVKVRMRSVLHFLGRTFTA